MMSPLIFETKTQDLYDLVILANCSDSVQKNRVLNRKILDENMFEKVKNNQLSVEDKLKIQSIGNRYNETVGSYFFEGSIYIIED